MGLIIYTAYLLVRRLHDPFHPLLFILVEAIVAVKVRRLCLSLQWHEVRVPYTGIMVVLVAYIS